MICLSLELCLFGWKQESVQIKGTGEEREWVDEWREGFSSCDGNLHLSLPVLADFTGRKKQCSSDQVSYPAGLEDSKGSFNYHAMYSYFLLKNSMHMCRFFWMLFENGVSTPFSRHFSWKWDDCRYRYCNVIDSMNFRTRRDWYTHFLVAGETEISESIWLSQGNLFLPVAVCLCVFYSTVEFFCFLHLGWESHT